MQDQSEQQNYTKVDDVANESTHRGGYNNNVIREMYLPQQIATIDH